MLQPKTCRGSTTLSGALLGASAHRLFASRDVAETRTQVARVMKPHDLRVVSGQRVEARMHHAALGDVCISRLRYGADVDIDPGPLGDFFLVMMPLDGHSHISCGTQELESCNGLGSVASPSLPLKMRWSGDNDQLMVRVASPFLERMLAAQRGRPLDHPLEFRLGFEWRNCTAWLCVVRFLVDCAESGLDPSEHKLMVAHAEVMVATTLLAAQPHNYRDEFMPQRGAIVPRQVHRVKEYLRAHAHEPVNATQLAEVAGCSLRSLYAGFQEFCGQSPMQYLRGLRLERVRSDLLSGCVSTSVSGVALRWGFGHLGRFSSEYKARFGEHPSETLRHA
jgi:AraC-like DNA-binding protein